MRKYRVSRFLVKSRVVFAISRLTIKGFTKFFTINRLDEYYHKLTYLRMLEHYEKKNVKIGSGSILYNVTVSSSYKGDHFTIGKNCCLTGCTLLGHDASPGTFISELIVKKEVYLPGSRRSYRLPIRIGDNVFVGTNAIILAGITIENNVIVGAGSVVTKNIPSGSIVAGNPARIIGNISNFTEKFKILFNNYPERF